MGKSCGTSHCWQAEARGRQHRKWSRQHPGQSSGPRDSQLRHFRHDPCVHDWASLANCCLQVKPRLPRGQGELPIRLSAGDSVAEKVKEAKDGRSCALATWPRLVPNEKLWHQAVASTAASTIMGYVADTMLR